MKENMTEKKGDVPTGGVLTQEKAVVTSEVKSPVSGARRGRERRRHSN